MDRIEAMGAAIHQQKMAEERASPPMIEITQADREWAAYTLNWDSVEQALGADPTDKNQLEHVARSAAEYRTHSTAHLQAQLDMAVAAIQEALPSIAGNDAFAEKVLQDALDSIQGKDKK